MIGILTAKSYFKYFILLVLVGYKSDPTSSENEEKNEKQYFAVLSIQPLGSEIVLVKVDTFSYLINSS